MVPEATWRIRADGRFAGLPVDPRHDRQRLAGRPRSSAAGMNDHVAKPIDKEERLVLCLLGHLGRSGASAPATAADAGELVEARGDIVGRWRQPGADRPGVAALRSDMQDLFAQLERQLGEGDVQGSAATLHTIKGSASTVGASALPAVPASWSRCAPRRSAARYGNPRRHPPRRTAHPVRCLPAPPAGDVRRRAGGVGELNPGAVACPAKDSGGPGLACIRCGLGRITPWALSADTPEARPGLERHPLPVVQCLQASRSRSWALSRA